MKQAIYYAIEMPDPNAHLFRIKITVNNPMREGQLFRLPAWIPGSYMIREFARNIVQIHAISENHPVHLSKLDKHSWQAAPCHGPLSVTYDVYAWDLSVRSAHLDQTHAFFNGAAVFLEAIGHSNLPHIVDIKKPDIAAAASWRVATALPEYEATRYGFGTYRAENYDELIDSPVEIGHFLLGQFEAFGVPHDIAITGIVPNIDIERVENDLKKICETEIAFFEPESQKSPVSRYVFLITVVKNGYGGLEHRASSALLCSRASLPAKRAIKNNLNPMPDEYVQFLGLCSHEYFHTWNVKRIKPAVFVPYDLRKETYTRLLWLFEGVTSYYDDLLLYRSGLIDVRTYLQLIANTMGSALRGKGQLKQSIAEASFDAWIKYYRQDENAPNALTSYYTKGALAALALDLTIRLRSEHKKSFDDIMRELWKRFGRHFYRGTPRGITDNDVEKLIEEICGFSLTDFLQKYIYGTQPLPLTELLKSFGITVQNLMDVSRPGLDIRIKRSGPDCIVTHVYEGGAAHRAGIAAGDVLLAMGGLRISPDGQDNLEKQLARYQKDDTVTIHIFRRDELMKLDVVLSSEYSTPKYALALDKDENEAAKAARQNWLKK